MRALTVLLLAASPAFARQGAILALSGDANPTLHRLHGGTGALIASHPVSGHQFIAGGMAFPLSANISGAIAIDGPDDVNPDRLLSIDPVTGAATALGSTGFNRTNRCIARGPAFNTMYIIGDNTVYTASLVSGQATPVAPLSGSPRLDQVTAFTMSAFTATGYVTDTTDTDLFSVNTLNGQLTWIGPIGGSGNPYKDLALYGFTELLGVRANGGIYRIDIVTAAETLLYPGAYTGIEYLSYGGPHCYPNCDQSTAPRWLSANDFVCFLSRWAQGNSYADCDGVHGFTANDFICFLTAYNNGCQ